MIRPEFQGEKYHLKKPITNQEQSFSNYINHYGINRSDDFNPTKISNIYSRNPIKNYNNIIDSSNTPKNINSQKLFSSLGTQIMNPFLYPNNNNYNFNHLPKKCSSTKNQPIIVRGFPVTSTGLEPQDFYTANSTNYNNKKNIRDAKIIYNKYEEQFINEMTIKSKKDKKQMLEMINIIHETIPNEEQQDLDKKDDEEQKENNSSLINTETKFRIEKWWKLVKNFANIYKFFQVTKKYSDEISSIKKTDIEQKINNVLDEINTLRKWILDLQKEQWILLTDFKNNNYSFTNSDPFSIITKNTQKIFDFIRTFFDNFFKKSLEVNNIPEIISPILYSYIKKNAYYPSGYLSSLQINRMDFNFLGSAKNNNIEQCAMIISFLLICNIIVQQILLNIKEVFQKLTKTKNLEISCKYIGSILYYMTRNIFIDKIKPTRDYLGLMNYYRCYKIFDENIEKGNNIHDIYNPDKNRKFFENYEKINKDIYNIFLIDEKRINKFWKVNPVFVTNFQNNLYDWSIKFSQTIKDKFENESEDE